MKTFKQILNPARGKMAYEMFGINNDRRIQVELNTMHICQRYYDNEQTITLQDVLFELEEKHQITPQDEADLAYIIFSVSMALNFYYESHGLKYQPYDNN